MEDDGKRGENFILFELAGTTYGIPSRVVRQVEMVEQVTPVPNTPAFVEGVVLLRGRVIPAIDLRIRFGFPKAPYDIRTRLIVVDSKGRTVGLIVDTAREFVTIPPAAISDPPEAIAGLSGEYLAGVARLGQRVVLAIDVDRLLEPAPRPPEPDYSLPEEMERIARGEVSAIPGERSLSEGGEAHGQEQA